MDVTETKKNGEPISIQLDMTWEQFVDLLRRGLREKEPILAARIDHVDLRITRMAANGHPPNPDSFTILFGRKE